MRTTERFNDPQEALRTVVEGLLAGVWTASVGIVQSFDPDTVTAVLAPAIKSRVRKQGPESAPSQITYEFVEGPLWQDVPVIAMRGGGCTLTFPVKAGDEALVVFCARDYSSWWELGGIQAPGSLRMHSLADGFAIIGPFSQKTKIANWNPDTVQLRSDTGETYVELDPAAQAVNVVAGGDVTVQAGGDLTATVTGDASLEADNVDLTATGDVTANIGGDVSATITGGMTAVVAGSVDLTAPTINFDTDLLHVRGFVQAAGYT